MFRSLYYIIRNNIFLHRNNLYIKYCTIINKFNKENHRNITFIYYNINYCYQFLRKISHYIGKINIRVYIIYHFKHVCKTRKLQ